MKKILKEQFSSSNLYDKMSLLTEMQVSDIYKGLEWTTKNYKNAVVIGGTAVVYYLKGGRNLTPDMDFLVGDILELKEKLESQNIRYNLIRGDVGAIGITVDEFNTDYLDINSGNIAINKLILKTYKIVMVGGYSVKIIIPELLAIMKIELGRDKDLDDGLTLITSKILNKEVYIKLVEGLKKYLRDYESLKSYAELI